MKIARCFTLGSLTICAATGSAPLLAGTAVDTIAVSVTVEESCDLQTQPLHFGALPSEHGSIDARSSIALNCTPAASYVVAIDDGVHGTRRMADSSGTDYLAYELYSDAARTRRWGQSATAVSAVMPANGRAELPVYARLAAGGAGGSGAYADTVTVTVSF